MMTHFGKYTLQLGMLAMCGVSSLAFSDQLSCPAFVEPEKTKTEWVAPYMIFNGVPMSVKRFDSEQSPAAILAFYRRAWAQPAGQQQPVENDVPPWQTIGVVQGKCFFSVQVQTANLSGSTGLLSATQATDKPRIIPPEKALPMMTGSQVVNDIEHRDPGKTARTLLLSNTFSPETNADFYRRTLTDQGWKILNSYQMKTAKGPGITIVLKKQLAETNIVITREGSNTMILANLVDKP
ncbi:hypothetical protein [Oxalicibacterium faecigallinarum]|uniref:Toxin co-regulated pilus biosynthesis protein Q C-terminal domain-containing protein n=1 Tax=Oxalicibacterium faecigallinarum TaxID=573741 RepID=A0A8J3F303_9BURK|nr:hypothetical protein [Oxalicibacterium faecigallinarum]GGI18499.1 hypothetical protein GCM10008066_14320 [Oxalicibacterium faecigallinarum]